MFLCKTCNAANGNAFPAGKCYICDDMALKAPEMAARAAELVGDSPSFSISTMIPKDWLAREEKAWDIRLGGAESIKSHINRALISALRKGGRVYDGDGECRIIFDFSSGKVERSMNEIFVFGRYRKLAAGLSQSRWRCSACDGKGCAECGGKGKFYESVEERIGEPFKQAAGAADYVMHASGREDVDATNSAGRAFVLEIKSPATHRIELEAVASQIGKGGEVSVSDLRIVRRGFAEVVTESHFDKTYEALTEFERPLDESALGKIRAIEGRTILQQTPNRVSHRRADLVRHRKVKHIEVVNAAANRATIIVKAEAGTYIKELISGDMGRTNPSVAGELGMKAECKKLEVTMIDDGYLDFCLESISRT
ncbi:MAG: tRNA pseudouridine(54/55) synthase Pus10 [Candidatus Micrarchaeia archaeon]